MSNTLTSTDLTSGVRRRRAGPDPSAAELRADALEAEVAALEEEKRRLSAANIKSLRDEAEAERAALVQRADETRAAYDAALAELEEATAATDEPVEACIAAMERWEAAVEKFEPARRSAEGAAREATGQLVVLPRPKTLRQVARVARLREHLRG